jgi:lysophospholipase L1-like esterase
VESQRPGSEYSATLCGPLMADGALHSARPGRRSGAWWLALALAACQSEKPKPRPPAPAPEVRAPAPAEPEVEVFADESAARGPWDGDVELQPLADKLGARAVAIEDPTGGLALFFSSVQALAAGAAQDDVVIAAFGNSIIAGDKVVDRVREAMVWTFGEGGRGLLLADRMAAYGNRARTGLARATAWEPRTLGEIAQLPLPVGLTGVYHRARVPNASSRFHLQGEPAVNVWWQDNVEGGDVTFRADDKVLARATGKGDGEVHSDRIEVPVGAETFEIIAAKPGTVLQGVVFDLPDHGLVLDTLGVPSADASFWLKADPKIFRAQLEERKPDLLLFMLGGNEVKRIQWGKTNFNEVKRGLTRLIRRARAAAPQAGCLVVGPLDAVEPGKARQYVERKDLKKVISIQRKVALAERCAFYDLFKAMGGSGSIKRFDDAGLMHSDRVHPRAEGLDILGNLLARALLDAWAERSPAAAAGAVK